MEILFFLPTPWVFAFLSVLTVGIVGIMMVRNYRSRKVQLRFEQSAKDWGLKSAFINPRNYKIFGFYHGYDVQMVPFATLPDPSLGQGVRLSLPISNPQLKIFRVAKTDSSAPDWKQLFPITHPVSTGQELGKGLEIQTNDLFLSSLILSDDVKIDLGILFNKISSGLFVIYGAEMAFYLPGPPTHEVWQEALDIMCEVKDELKGG